MTPTQIEKAFDYCLSDTYHRPRLLDKGIQYLVWQWWQISASMGQALGKRGMCSRATQYLPTRAAVARHEWEHEFVRAYEREPDHEESRAEYEKIVNRLHKDSPGSFDEHIEYTCSQFGCGFGTIDPKTFKPTPVPAAMQLDALAGLINKAVTV